jgi:hypothetical protein
VRPRAPFTGPAQGGCRGEEAAFSELQRYSPEDGEEAGGQLSLATSILSTKALVESQEDYDPGRGGAGRGAPRPGRTYECEDLCRQGAMLGVSTVGMTVLVVGYLLLGAVAFSALEGGGSSGLPARPGGRGQAGASQPTLMNSTALLGALPAEVTAYIDRLRERTVTKLWDMTEKMNILYPANWTRGAAEEMLSFQDLLSRKLAAELMRRGGEPGHTLPYSQHQPRDWDLARGLLYSLSLVTTIGGWSLPPPRPRERLRGRGVGAGPAGEPPLPGPRPPAHAALPRPGRLPPRQRRPLHLLLLPAQVLRSITP